MKRQLLHNYGWWVVAILSLVVDCDAKKDRNVPHHHNGKIKPYVAGPFPSLKLSRDEIGKLQSGQSVMKQTVPDKPEEGGSAICIQDVNAPCDAVWYQILDMDSYSKKVSKVNENKNYVVKKNGDGTTTIKTKQVLGVLPGYSVSEFSLSCCLNVVCVLWILLFISIFAETVVRLGERHITFRVNFSSRSFSCFQG
jgi:hypothetical protein